MHHQTIFLNYWLAAIDLEILEMTTKIVVEYGYLTAILPHFGRFWSGFQSRSQQETQQKHLLFGIDL